MAERLGEDIAAIAEQEDRRRTAAPPPRSRPAWRLILLLAPILLIAAERPTGNGDPMGIASLDRNGRLTLQLRSVQCDGMVAESLVMTAPGDADYAVMLRWVGRIRRGETRPLIARDLTPCPAKRAARARR